MLRLADLRLLLTKLELILSPQQPLTTEIQQIFLDDSVC